MLDASLVIPKYIVPPRPDFVKILKNDESALQNLRHPGFGEKNSFAAPF